MFKKMFLLSLLVAPVIVKASDSSVFGRNSGRPTTPPSPERPSTPDKPAAEPSK